MLAVFAVACAPHATASGHSVLLITMHEDRLRPSAGEPKGTTTQIFTTTTGSRIDRFYALVRDSATSQVLEETPGPRAAVGVRGP